MSRAPLRIAAAQPHIVPFDVAANALTHASTVREAQSRVVVFPELSLTGYELDAPTIDLDDAQLEPIIEVCTITGSLALVGAPVDEGGSDFIATLAIDASGVSIAYRKMWLGDAEAERFVPGGAPSAIDVDGWRLGLAVCKDTRVEAHAMATTALSIDAYVGGMLESAGAVDIAAERATRVARDHRVWVAIASYAGPAGGGFDNAAGGSGVWAPDASERARAGSAVGDVACAALSDDE